MFYQAIIWLEENDTYSVMFPDLEGCFTMGETLLEAKENAIEVLDLYLEDNPIKGFHRPTVITNTNDYKELSSRYIEIFDVNISKHKAFALKLRWLRQDLGLTQKVLASRLNIGLYAYQRLENPKSSNATIKTIEQVENSIKQELINI